MATIKDQMAQQVKLEMERANKLKVREAAGQAILE